MAYETGHAKNIERFSQMLTFLQGYGAAYNPANSDLGIANLQGLRDDAEQAMVDLTGKVATNKVAINTRKEKFDIVKPLATRALNSFAVSGAGKEAFDDAKGYKRKLDGKRAEPKVDDPNTPENEAANSISASQQSYAKIVEHFDNFISILVADGHYAPNEADLGLVVLTSLSDDLKAANTEVMAPCEPRSSASIVRDYALSSTEFGLVERAAQVKKYVKSVFGPASPEYKQISSLRFTRPR